MKQFIHKVNRYLIENHPTLWNTKIVWMLSIAAILHLFFFLFGMVILTDPESLQERSAFDIFFENGTIFFSVMVSIILLVGWLISLLKNNAFKNFYPTNRFSLFKQFIIYLIIIFASTTFYYSYTAGLKTYITIKYSDEDVLSEIALANKTAPFFSHSLKRYTLDNIIYPEPFTDLYCETNDDKIEYSKTNFNYLNQDYQFYNLYAKTRNLNKSYPIDTTLNYSIYEEIIDSIRYFYFKDKVVDISDYLITNEPSYYNYSKVFYTPKSSRFNGSDLTYYDIENNNNYNSFKYSINATEKKLQDLLVKEKYELLNRCNRNEIKAILEQFIGLAKKYKIKHNLDAETWSNLIYTPDAFKLNAIIQNEKQDYEPYRYKTELTPFEERHLALKTDYYLESDRLGIVFENIEEIKAKRVVGETIHIFLWLSFCLALIIFMFRITGLKSLLFSIISTGLLTIFVSLIFAFYAFVMKYSSDKEYFMSYFTLIIGIIILTLGLFYSTKIRKKISAIFINITLAGFVPFVLLIIAIISMHQSDACGGYNRYITYDGVEHKEPCFILIESIGLHMSSVLFIIGLVFIYFYSKTILNWKAMPEG